MMKHLTTNILQAQQVFANNFLVKIVPFTEIEPFIPKATASLLASYKQNYGTLHNWEQYFSFFKYKLMTMSPEDLRHIYEIEEGLEHRILSKIQTSSLLPFIHGSVKKRNVIRGLDYKELVHIF